MNYFVSILIGTIIGLIPNYFLSERLFVLFKIENNKKKLLVSFLLDLLKGLLVVLVTKYLLSLGFTPIIISLLTTVLSHSFIQGLKLQRAEGQNVALGGLSIFLPMVVLIWLTIWIISYLYKKNISFSLISSTFLTGLLSVTSSDILNDEYWRSNPTADSDSEFSIFIGLLFTLLLLTQIDKFKSYFQKVNLKDN